MIPYTLHVSIILSVSLLFYKLFLQRETFYRLNRWMLLSCLAVAFILPLVRVPAAWSLIAQNTAAPTYPTPTNPAPAPQATAPSLQSASAPASQQYIKSPTPQVQYTPLPQTQIVPSPQIQNIAASPAQNTPTQTSQAKITPATQPNAWPRILHALWLIWLSGMAILGCSLLLQIFVLLARAYTRPVIKDGRFRIIRMSGEHAPCSFGKYIFINASRYDQETCDQILLHEKAHAGGWHSLDILLAELAIIFQWFNPCAWLYRKAVENNLEFLADRAVLSDPGVERSSYQMSLLKVSAPAMLLSITSNYNQSLLKRRIIMMNTKHSSLHTVWKYFVLLPVLTLLVCTLNRPGATAQSVKTKPVTSTSTGTSTGTAVMQTSVVTDVRRPGDPVNTVVVTGAEPSPVPAAQPLVDVYPLIADTAKPDRWADRTQGAWFATSSNDKLCIELKGDEQDHHWSNSSCIPRSEFTGLGSVGKVEFKLTRDAGTMTFSGQFDGDQGFGHYTFTADEHYLSHLKDRGLSVNSNDMVSFFFINMKKDYPDMLQANGFPHISKEHLISMAALHIDEPFIRGWKEEGYTDISEEKLISAKALSIDKTWLSGIRSAGYDHPAIDKLISFKALGINGDYIRRLKQGSGGELPPAEQIISYKSLNIDSEYIAGFNAIGYRHIPANELISMKSMGIKADFVKTFTDLGYQDIEPQSLISLKALGITADYIKSFNDIGYKNIPLNHLSSIKSMGITPAYVKGFQDIGYKDIPLESLNSLKAMNISPEFIKAFNDIGYKNIPLHQLSSLKAMGVNADYVRKMRAKGFVSDDLNKYMHLKNAFNVDAKEPD